MRPFSEVKVLSVPGNRGRQRLRLPDSGVVTGCGGPLPGRFRARPGHVGYGRTRPAGFVVYRVAPSACDLRPRWVVMATMLDGESYVGRVLVRPVSPAGDITLYCWPLRCLKPKFGGPTFGLDVKR